MSPGPRRDSVDDQAAILLRGRGNERKNRERERGRAGTRLSIVRVKHCLGSSIYGKSEGGGEHYKGKKSMEEEEDDSR